MDGEVEQLLHLYLLNRGVLITPFHNMMLVSPQTTPSRTCSGSSMPSTRR